MFRNFTFETAARHPSGIGPDTFDNDFDSMCPLSESSFPLREPTPPIDPLDSSISDLSRQLSEQSLHQYSSHTTWRKNSVQPTIIDLPTPPDEPSSPRAVSPDPYFDGITSASCRSSSPPYLSNSTSSIRQQRQRAVRRQCSSSHLREISELVSRMVQDRDQCSFRTPPITPTSAPSPSFDECVASRFLPSRSMSLAEPCNMDDNTMDVENEGSACSSGSEDGRRGTIKYRRSNDATSVRVGKSSVPRDPRVRKHNKRKGSIY